MVGRINIIIMAISAGAFVILPLVFSVVMIIRKKTKSMLLGMASFSIYGIVVKNLIFSLIFLVPFLKTRLSSDYIVYSLFIGITSALIHMVTRYALHIKIGIKDKAAFSAGESVIQCIYVGIPTTIIGLGYAVAINLGGFEYVGITNKVLPALTSLINADYTEYLPYVIYPFFVFALNRMTVDLFIKNKFVSALTEAVILSIYSYFMLCRLYIPGTIFLLAVTVVIVVVLIVSASKKQVGKRLDSVDTTTLL
ncbi:MAG TPA: hypothetical protein P5064_07605 [Clostridia bacterium]|jgi:hypothetical protein|nr:hypothetical protein [Clostridiaceae bacterium]HOF26122.1 hypothetical protein [Clostridia bacterium]HOM33915.1 hypothetical protein [Clostridia bacterium]HOR89508.1 hypothetical protein [Clostridia bacterium]HOT69817.1 hypothetical protein [Clostridia bacterium]